MALFELLRTTTLTASIASHLDDEASPTIVEPTDADVDVQNQASIHSVIGDKEGERVEQTVRPPSAPDGGYGWVVMALIFLSNAATFGQVNSFGVFLSFYRENSYFPGATDIQFAFIGGLIVAAALAISPLSNYLGQRFGVRVAMVAGVLLYTGSQIAAAFSTQIWQLFLSQGLAMGIGIGLVFIPGLPLLSQWFTKHRALALGIAAGGSGGGSVMFSIVTRAWIESLGLRWAFIVNALVCFVVLVPVVLLIKDRAHITGKRHAMEPLELHWLVHPGCFWVWVWAFFSTLGYVFGVNSVPTYATTGLGLTQTQAANLQAILSAGQMVGRPCIGLVADRVGRINTAAIFSFIAGFSCLVVWMLSRSYGVLIFFALIQGLTGGTFWAACAPVTAEVVGVHDMGSAMAMLWLVCVIPNLVAEAIGLQMVNYSQNTLGMQGANAYLIAIGFTGGCFLLASISLLGTKRYVQGNWKIWQRS